MVAAGKIVATREIFSMRPVVLVTVLLALCGQMWPKYALAGQDFSGICAGAVHAAEIGSHLPPFLLHAVSLAESGRWSERRQAAVAWPWTITAGGEGKFFRTKEKALAEIRQLLARGVTNIDVGCMQINLRYHGDAFRKLEEAIEPINNVAYAAAFLRHLRLKSGSWAHAIGKYHTNNWKGRGKDYWRRVRSIWTAEKRRDYRARRAVRMEKNRRLRLADRR